MQEMTTIRITKELQNVLSSKGIKGDTYEEIIWRLIKKEEDKKCCGGEKNGWDGKSSKAE